jgi:hypothetical protein
MVGRILRYFVLPLLLFLSNSSGNSAPRTEPSAPEGFNPGPDIITGDIGAIGGLTQFGSSGTQVGLGVSTTACNAGNQTVRFLGLPSTNHPIIPHNLYRMSGGPDNNDRFEQIGQSWVKHAFAADQLNECGFGCIPSDSGHLGVGCSDTYASSQNAAQDDLGSRALVNPFTGVFQSTANNHAGHTHTETSHRILVEGSDLNTMLNPGATYYAEVQYISSDEYEWCQAHPGQCNMYNNASYRQFTVSGTTSFTFSEVGFAVHTAAINAWPGATINPIEPEPGTDGRAFVACRVTNPSAGVWHYEYAIYNENLDRAIQSFSVPLGCGTTVSNLGFHAPLNHPGFPNDGTLGGAGFSNAAWSSSQTASEVSWSTETFAQNQNANAIRWGTLYNFRFDSAKPPLATNAMIGFFKTGTPVTVAVVGPNVCDLTPTPTPTATPTPATPTPTATPCTGTVFTENFDGVTAPALPPGWGGSGHWATSTATPDTAPNDAFVDDPDFISDKRLDSPNLIVSSASAQVSFRNSYNLETGYDGGVLEISSPNINAGAFTDVTDPAVGGSFVSGGYNSTIATNSFSPIAGRQAWSGNSGGYFNTVVRLGPNVDGQTIKLRFRMASDVFVSDVGWRIDTVTSLGACMGPISTPTPGPSPTPTPTSTPAAHALNLSTRMRVLSEDNVGIGGFVITGSAPKHVLLRVIGPSLAQSGVPNVLADPELELHGPGGFVTITNDNWRDDPAQEAAIIATGIPPTDNLESAIDATLDPGSYTGIVRGKNNTTGVGLIEVYDLNQAASKLANISTRAFVGTGSDIVIAGFILGGNTGSTRIVLRGLGPSLSSAGVSNPLPDPTIQLRDANGALLRSNNNWTDDPAQMVELIAAGLAPTNQLESAIATPLPPGLYTALVAGLNNTTGVGLVEVYELSTPARKFPFPLRSEH